MQVSLQKKCNPSCKKYAIYVAKNASHIAGATYVADIASYIANAPNTTTNHHSVPLQSTIHPSQKLALFY
jgi:hypothetical protein